MQCPEDRLRERIGATGPLSFREFMDEALYGQDGYYSQPAAPIGPQGDYITGSSASPFFAQATARLVEKLDGVVGRAADFLEVGYGGGEHVTWVAAAVGQSGIGRRILATDRLHRSLPEPVRVVESLEEIGERTVEGLVFTYELFDALPIHRLVRRGRSLVELYVALEDDVFVWREGELSDHELEQWNSETLEEGQIIDVTPEWGSLYRDIARRLHRGLMVTCDYGFTRKRLLDARVRRHGTLACYRRHRVHRNPFVDVGKQDMTAHVDLTLLEGTGRRQGLETVGLYRQAEWLAMLGILDGMENRSPAERVEIMELMNLEGMGDEIRVLVQKSNIDASEVLPRQRHPG